MDYEEMKKAYESAKKTEKSVNNYPDGWNPDNQPTINFSKTASNQPYIHVTIEHDYSIVKMPDGGYVVARSERLGSLDYDFVCSCASHWEAKQIVRGLCK